jgi:hypothetical protein
MMHVCEMKFDGLSDGFHNLQLSSDSTRAQVNARVIKLVCQDLMLPSLPARTDLALHN